MRQKNIVIIAAIAAVILAIIGVGAYIMLTPQYKSININGYSLEVPESDNDIIVVNENYKTYEDKQNNLSIKSYAINNINQTNYTGALDIKSQLNKSKGQNISLANKTLTNKDNTYTYYDLNTYQMITITCTDKKLMEHMLESLNKTAISPVEENLTIDLTEISENTTNITETKTTKKASYNTKKSTKTTQKKQSKKSSDDEWYDVIVPGTNGKKTVKAKPDKFTDYGHRYVTQSGEAIYV